MTKVWNRIAKKKKKKIRSQLAIVKKIIFFSPQHPLFFPFLTFPPFITPSPLSPCTYTHTHTHTHIHIHTYTYTHTHTHTHTHTYTYTHTHIHIHISLAGYSIDVTADNNFLKS